MNSNPVDTLQSQLREETKGLMAQSSAMILKGIVFSCQKRCINLEDEEFSKNEQECLAECADQYTYFDNAQYELDSAQVIAAQQGKPKKAFMYYQRRIEDLTQ